MNKTVKKVFMLLALLVGIFLAWQLIFNDGGILQSVYNSVASGINRQYARVAGQGRTLVPYWGTDNQGNAGSISNADNNGQGFDIDETR